MKTYKLTIFGEDIIDSGAVEQLINCLHSPTISFTPMHTTDMPIPLVEPLHTKTIFRLPVGFDIAWQQSRKTPVKAAEVDVPKVMDEIFSEFRSNWQG